MKKIETYKALKQEIRLSRQKLVQLEMSIDEDVAEIKKSLHPLNVAKQAVKGMFSSEGNGIMGESIGLTVDALLGKLLLRRSGWITKLLVGFLAKNFTKNIVSKNADTILHWIANKLRTPSGSENGHYYYNASSDVDWDT